MSRLERSQAEKSAQALCGDIRLASRRVGGQILSFAAIGHPADQVNVPGLDGPGGKPIQAAGDILPIQSKNFLFVERWLAGKAG